jgi:hypothetical protein
VQIRCERGDDGFAEALPHLQLRAEVREQRADACFLKMSDAILDPARRRRSRMQIKAPR